MRMLMVMGMAGVLAGCAMPFDDMHNNQYMNHQAQAVPAGMDDSWTGVMGPYLMTLQLNEDGTGKLCNSYGASNYLQVVKYNSGMVYIQDGTRMSATFNGDTLTAKFPYTGSKPAGFQRDSDLAMAAPYCRQNL